MLLAGRPGAAQEDRGAIVCACFDVGVNTIVGAIARGEVDERRDDRRRAQGRLQLRLLPPGAEDAARRPRPEDRRRVARPPMKTFPMFLKMAGRRVVILGGGEQAAQKTRLMLKTEAEIVVVAATLDPELAALAVNGVARVRAFAYLRAKAREWRQCRDRGIFQPAGRAARAGWLYYIAGKTQDEIAVHDGDLPPGRAAARVARGRREACARVDGAPDRAMPRPCRALSGGSGSAGRSGAERPRERRWHGRARRGAAAEMARWLRAERPIMMAVGTGRTLKAAIDHLPPIPCPQHSVVSLTGNIGPDG